MPAGAESIFHTDAGIKPMDNDPDISVILPFHNEGRLAHRTLRGLDKSLTFAVEHGLKVESVILLDRVTDETLRKIISQWIPRLGNCQALNVDYGCLSLTRNHGVSRSGGRFIALLDGDDIFCRDWLVKAFEICKSTGAIAHPQLCYFFPLENHLFVNQSIAHYRTLIHHNLWSVLVMAPRAVFEEVPYRPDTECFGFEDWLWNCETVAAGFHHVTVPQTVIAVRQKPASDSLCLQSGLNNKVVAPNSLFKVILSEPYHRVKRKHWRALRNFSSAAPENAISQQSTKGELNDPPMYESAPGANGINSAPPPSLSLLLKSLLTLAPFRFVRDRMPLRYRYAIREMMRLAKELALVPLALVRSALGFTHLRESWLREKLVDLADIEPQMRFYGPLWTNAPKSRIHRHICPTMGALLETNRARVFIVPWLVRGGAELVALHYMNAVQENVFFITTVPAENRLLKYTPATSAHIDIGNMPLSEGEKALLLHRLLLEADCEFVHVISSRLAFDIFHKYHRTFKNHRIFASFFATEIIEEFEVGCAVEDFPKLLDFFQRVSTDSQSFKKRLEDLYGIPEDLIVAHRMPFSPPHYNMTSDDARHRAPIESTSNKNESLRVLFAGRLAREKRPEIAIQAVEALLNEGKKVTLDVWGEPSISFAVNYSRRPEIQLKGAFDGLASIKPTQYDVMILTSESEGLPNALIECMGNGIPAIASNVGGVNEIVTDETGWLVTDYNNAGEFQRVLEGLIQDKGAVRKKGASAKEFVAKHHSWVAFQEQAADFYGLSTAEAPSGIPEHGS
jgi:glycosyltransferase involved in cell wall biosynthesis